MKEKNLKSFIIKFAIFSILLIGLTIFAIYITIQYINQNDNTFEQKTTEPIEKDKTKVTATDSKYGIQSYNETYDLNSLQITNYYDVNGKITTENPMTADMTDVYVNYIEIQGLKDKSIQNSINDKLKQTAYSLKNDKSCVHSWVTANFSNVLSVNFHTDYNDNKGLNIDLTTGNDIPLEKVFVSSAPLNTYLADGLYKSLAWIESEKEDYESLHDMNNYDTSEYEDKFLMLINKYNKIKDNIEYNIFPSAISIYGLIDKEIVDNDNIDNSINIEFFEHIEEIAIYKRFLTTQNIYENDDIGAKDIIVLTPYIEVDGYIKNLSYGKIQDNIFVEEVIEGDLENISNLESITEYIKKLSNEQKETLKKRNLGDTGLFFQRIYYIEENEKYNVIYLSTSETTCSRDYFENSAFKDYIKLKLSPTVEAQLLKFDPYMKDTFPNMKISDETHSEVYISKDGKFLGYTEQEANKNNLEV